MSLLVDTTPLRVSRDFRRLWLGQAVSLFGSMITAAALPYQVYHQTGSSLAVGLLGVAQLGPLLGFSLVGGALADGVDKRRLLLAVTAAGMACVAALAVNSSLDHPQLWLLYVVGAASSGLIAFSFPVVRSLLPLLLDSGLRPAAFALQSIYGSFGMMAGPAVGGALIALLGLTAAYTVDVATYGLGLLAFAGVAPSPPVPGAPRASPASVLQGLRFLRGHSVILSIFGLDLLAMTFGMPRALFPALADRLGGGPTLYGLLLSSVAAGAFVASLASGWTARVRRQGRAVLWAVAAWGAAVAVAGLVSAGRRVQRTRYRPDRWRGPEVAVMASGLGVAVVGWWVNRYQLPIAYPDVSAAPEVSLLALVGGVAGVLAVLAAPRPKDL